MTTISHNLAELGPAAVALSDLVVRRGGGTELEIARFDEPGEPRWFAQALWRGVRIAVSNKPTAEAAADALAHKMLNGARCRCGGIITTGSVPPDSPIRWCRWARVGTIWSSTCDAPPIPVRANQPGDLQAIGEAFREVHGDPPR